MTRAEMTLCALYERTTPTVRRRGRTWYPQARRLCGAMADEYGFTLAQVAAVLAITSVDAQLSTNLRWTEEILRGEREAGRYPADQAPKVRAALATRYPGRVVTGPKCSAFYRAIMGDTDSLVIDRWAVMAVGHKGKRIPAALRRELEVGYRAAAAACGETVRAFQAITWIAVRETTPKKGRLVVIPRLADITA